MPNWCMNNMVIEGKKADVEKFRNLLLTWTSKEYEPSDFGKNWLGNIVLGAGFSLYEDGGLQCRGFVDSIGEVEDGSDGLSTFEVEFESAWSPIPKTWNAVMKKYAPRCKMYWSAIEPGNEVYETNDTAKKYFDADYFVDACITNRKNRLYESFQEAGEITRDELKKTLAAVFGKGTLEKLIEKAESVTLNESEWFSIHPFQYVL